MLTSEQKKDRRKRWLEQPRIMPDHDDDPAVVSLFDIERILRDELDFAPSCVDMDWKWEAEKVFTTTTTGVNRSVTDQYGTMHAVDHTGYRIRTNFKRPDRETGEVGRGWGGWHELRLDTTESAVVKRAFVAMRDILIHELMEAFLWKGARVLDPHNTVRELASIQSRRYLDTIP